MRSKSVAKLLGVSLSTALLLFIATPAITGSNADSQLNRALYRAQNTNDNFAIDYSFSTYIDAFGKTERTTNNIRTVKNDKEHFVETIGKNATKIMIRTQELCSRAEPNEKWTCKPIPGPQLAASLKSRHMSLYPPTAMQLLKNLLVRNPQAMQIVNLGQKIRASRTCQAFQIVMNAQKIGLDSLNEYLLVEIGDSLFVPYINAATVALCFDLDNGQVLEYQTALLLDQERMREDGVKINGSINKPIGTWHANLTAKLVK